jgi:hypothetical protein
MTWQIFEVAPTFYMVEMQKAAGDASEYEKVLQISLIILWSQYKQPKQKQKKRKDIVIVFSLSKNCIVAKQYGILLD